MYKMYANKSPYGEGWSQAFGIDANNSGTTTTSVVILTKPAKIKLTAERNHVVADNLDNIKITAYMYDALGNPVTDGYNINFTVGNATNNSFTDLAAITRPVRLDKATVASIAGQAQGISNSNPTSDNTGSASVQYGWVDDSYGGNNTTIWAYFADDPSIFASIKIYFKAPTASWTGYVVDSFGTGYGGITVDLHVMGYTHTNRTRSTT